MIPTRITEYLDRHGCKYRRLSHPRVVTAQELAASLHITGEQVGKVVVLEADGIKWLAVIPAPHVLDEELVADCLAAQRVRICNEDEFAQIFDECEVGAEPPFGVLFGLGVILDAELNAKDSIAFRAGTHTDAIEMSLSDFRSLEQPRIASISAVPEYRARREAAGAEASP